MLHESDGPQEDAGILDAFTAVETSPEPGLGLEKIAVAVRLPVGQH